MLKETRWVKCGSDFHCFDDAYGLGFVRQSPPTHRSYKIVRFRCARNDRDRPPRVEVYEFAYNSWKVLADITFDWHLKLPLSNVGLLGEIHTGSVFDKMMLSYKASIFPKKDFNPWINSFRLGIMSIIL